jgi:hypothetical protein
MLEHSPLGASGAERWAACSGSVTLIKLLADHAASSGEIEEDPDFRRDGIQAHELAALCLQREIDAWEGVEHFDLITPEMMDAVQIHVDYVRSRPGAKLVELRMHRPEFHELCYGTTDVAVLDPGHLEIIDYKHGAGIVVEVEENWQTMYYAFMVIDELGEAWKDGEPITLTIVQPRVSWHPDGVIRSWVTTVGYLRRWAHDQLRPAMVGTYTNSFLSPGEHCRFCPAKLVCPATLSVANRARRLSLEDVQALSSDVLSALLRDYPILMMVAKALRAEARKRIIGQREEIPGWKVVKAKADRVWKKGADPEQIGWQERKLKSPAMVEEDGRKEFVHEWAFAPDVGFDIVRVEDRRKPVKVHSAIEALSRNRLTTDDE